MTPMTPPESAATARFFRDARLAALSHQRARDARPLKFSPGSTIKFTNYFYRYELAINLLSINSRAKLNEFKFLFEGSPSEIVQCFAIDQDADRGFALAK